MLDTYNIPSLMYKTIRILREGKGILHMLGIYIWRNYRRVDSVISAGILAFGFFIQANETDD